MAKVDWAFKHLSAIPADAHAMKEALRPFAKAAGAMYVSGHCGGASPEDWPDRWVITIQGGIDFHSPQQHGGLLTVADFRRAAAAASRLSSPARMTLSDPDRRATTLTLDDLLTLLIEECSEVIKAATKCQRFGFDVDHGVGYGLNSRVLSQECGDVQAIMDALPLDIGAKETSRIGKIAKAEAVKERFGRPAPASSNDKR
jgi:hypothetical protein